MIEPRVLDQKRIDETSALFKQAEKNLKRAEHLTNKIFIPAINELRYAGYHLLAYLSSEGTDDNLVSAQKHCKRAIYDSAEGPLLKFLSDIAQFQTDYAKTCITSELPDYVTHMTHVQETRNLIASVQPETRDEYFKAVEPHLNKLSDIVNLLETARPEINKRMRGEQSKDRMVFIGVILAAIAVIFAITGPVSMAALTDAGAANKSLDNGKLLAGGVVQINGVAPASSVSSSGHE